VTSSQALLCALELAAAARRVASCGGRQFQGAQQRL